MLYAKLNSEGNIEKYPYSLFDLRKDNPYTSFPSEIDELIKNAYGLVEVRLLDKPEYDNGSQRLKESKPTLVEGEWVIPWVVEDFSEDELKAIEDNKIKEVRNLRNLFLQESDWVIIKAKETGTNIPVAWKNYRQELRDITSQEGFPHEVVWPTKPV